MSSAVLTMPPAGMGILGALLVPSCDCDFTLVGHSEMVTDVALSADGKWALSASADQTIKVWDLEKGAELSPLIGHADTVTGVAISPDGQWAVSASSDKTV